MFDLTGHVALVTGGNGGIGLGMARGLAKAGARIAVWGRQPAKNEAAVTELERLGTEAAAFACDVADEAQVVAQMAATVDRFGRIDSCFANAGYGRPGRFLDTSLEDWNAIVSVNLTGVFLTFREAARHMVERGGGGRLVATSSIGSIHGMPAQPHYSATKAAVNALVRSLAVELARHDIQANAILPGWIETDATAPAVAHERLYETVRRRTPARRWGRPDDLEAVAVYLAAPESRFHTGDVLTVDGGYVVF
jgi:NAD(P)-dependent dehydrogenase (short-subunit alcohol dehydrogenase family)